MKRNSVIPTPQNSDNDILVSFIDEAHNGRLRNVTINNKAIADAFKAHDAELVTLAEEYSVKHKAVTDKRAAIESRAFAAAEAVLAAEEAARKAAAEEAQKAATGAKA